jgi:flagellar hook-associated protein 2
MSTTSSALTSSTAATSSTQAYDVSSILAAVNNKSTTAIDVTAAVAAGIYADRAPERAWQADQTTLTSETTALTAMQTATQAIQTDMQSLNSLTGPLSERTVTSSASSEVTATAASGTVAGSHTVVVNNIASTGAWYSSLETSSTATLPTSSITITPASGTAVTIATGSGNTGDTLADLATAINKDNLGVTATVVSDSTGSRLAIISNSSGAAADFSISSSYTSWTAPAMTSGEALAASTIKLTGATSAAGSATITITAGETYAELATAINQAMDSNGNSLGLTATATTDSSGNANLSIASTDGSTPFTINEPSSTSGSLGFTQSVQGEDASLTVDGIPIDSASNTVTGAISGVTLNLLGASSTTAVNLTVASNATDVSTAINQFVTDYNTAIGLLNAQFTVSSSTDSSGASTSGEGVLASDPTVRSLQSALESAINYIYTPTSGTTAVASLYDLGITQGTDGTLSVDSTTLDNALANNATDVQNFFEGAALNGFAASVNNEMDTYTNAATGAFKVDLSSISTQNSDLTTQIDNYESSYIAAQQTQLTAMYTRAENALESLSTTMDQINALLGGNSNSGS